MDKNRAYLGNDGFDLCHLRLAPYRPLRSIRRKDNECYRNLSGVVIRDANDTGVRDVRMLQ